MKRVPRVSVGVLGPDSPPSTRSPWTSSYTLSRRSRVRFPSVNPSNKRPYRPGSSSTLRFGSSTSIPRRFPLSRTARSTVPCSTSGSTLPRSAGSLPAGSSTTAGNAYWRTWDPATGYCGVLVCRRQYGRLIYGFISSAALRNGPYGPAENVVTSSGKGSGRPPVLAHPLRRIERDYGPISRNCVPSPFGTGTPFFVVYSVPAYSTVLRGLI